MGCAAGRLVVGLAQEVVGESEDGLRTGEEVWAEGSERERKEGDGKRGGEDLAEAARESTGLEVGRSEVGQGEASRVRSGRNVELKSRE
jgi:hypothetical protein